MAGREFYAVIERDEDGYYVGEVSQLRACYAQGDTLDELMQNIKEVIELCLEDEGSEMSEIELRQEIAVLLFRKERASLGQASTLAGMNQLQFQRLLASRDITLHYDVAEFEEDLKTLEG